MTRAFLGLGSNVGDREAYLRDAIRTLGDEVEAVSQVYETDPVGGPGQGRYLNLVVQLDTRRSPADLLGLCRRLEGAAERVRRERWGPRTLDVDVLWVDGVEIATADLQVPHPRMFQRRFVLAPLSELAPDLVPPGWEEQAEGKVDPRGPLPQSGDSGSRPSH
jgi:2-amino-4-hydroxy-6-hydroxymethyldihydropteridine diphosphokinase